MNNYNTSKDYELLWELITSKGIEVVCFSDSEYMKVKHDICIANYFEGVVDIACRGICYIYARSKDKFIEACEKHNLEFILPNAWISVKDRLPEINANVLLVYYESNGSMCLINKYEVLKYIYCGITHWQPLPEPPEGE